MQHNDTAEEPASAWWVPHTVRKRDMIIKAMKKQHFRIHQKCGTEIPKSVKEGLALDASTGTTLWTDATRKEMKNVGVAFEILPERARMPVRHTHIQCHLVFNVKHGSL